MVFGSARDSDVDKVKKWFGWDCYDFPRFRDVEINQTSPKVTVLTRTGGGNREHYEEENYALTTINGYISDSDCDYDNTYAEWFYKVPKHSRYNWLKYVAKSTYRSILVDSLEWNINLSHSSLIVKFDKNLVTIETKSNICDKTKDTLVSLKGYINTEHIESKYIYTYDLTHNDKYKYLINLDHQRLIQMVSFNMMTNIDIVYLLTNPTLKVEIDKNTPKFSINRSANVINQPMNEFLTIDNVNSAEETTIISVNDTDKADFMYSIEGKFWNAWRKGKFSSCDNV
jgi:hypothetical protein